MGARTVPPGFQGLAPDKPLAVYYRHLPHWRQEGATYFVTFRQHDSLPQEKLRELEAFRKEWERRTDCQSVPRGRSFAGRTDCQSVLRGPREDLAREIMRRVERWLDQGLGSCRLKDPALARFIRETMHHFDGIRYELGCYVVMPNHVHLIVRPTQGGTDALEKILQSWKRYSARKINGVLGLTGPFWQEESFDRIIRDEDHLARAIQYIGDNPTRAALLEGQFHRWICPEWEQAGWTFTP